MPYKIDKIKLSESQDRRRKLSNEQKDTIREMYSTGNWSLNTLASKFSVSKKSILLIVNPTSAQRDKEYKKENWREFQKSKEEHAKAIRETRRYKQALYQNGELEYNA